ARHSSALRTARPGAARSNPVPLAFPANRTPFTRGPCHGRSGSQGPLHTRARLPKARLCPPGRGSEVPEAQVDPAHRLRPGVDLVRVTAEVLEDVQHAGDDRPLVPALEGPQRE